MSERDIARIISSRWVPRIGKHVVKLGFVDERAEDVWMTDRQLAQLEMVFDRTPRRHSTARAQVVGIWDDRGYYAYARLDRQDFIPPVRYRLKDLEDT